MRRQQVFTLAARYCLAGLLASLLVSCGTVTSVRQGAAIADAGTAYTSAMQSVSDLVIDKHIDWIAGGTAKQRLAAIPSERLRAQLLDDVATSQRYVHELMVFKAHTKRLGEYFDALNRLVKEDGKEAYTDATKELAGSLNQLGTVLAAADVTKQLKITDAQQTAAGALAGTVATLVHGQVVGSVLRRDAATIDSQMALEAAALKQFADKIAFIEELKDNAYYKGQVQEPYVARAADQSLVPLPPDWRDRLDRVIRGHQLETQLALAQSTLDKLRVAWRDYVAGKATPDDLLAEAKLFRDVAGEASTLHKNRP